jgi:hypothetical protein
MGARPVTVADLITVFRVLLKNDPDTTDSDAIVVALERALTGDVAGSGEASPSA